jgi:hypothetical protein
MGDEDGDRIDEAGVSRRAFMRRMMAAGFVAPVVGSFSFAEMASAAGRNRHKPPDQYYPNQTPPPQTTHPPLTTPPPRTTPPPQTTPPYQPPPEHCEPEPGGHGRDFGGRGRRRERRRR